MKKQKRYEFSSVGYVKMLWDLRQEKLGKINSVMSLALIIGLFGLGLLGKELFIIMVANMGINKVTSWLIG